MAYGPGIPYVLLWHGLLAPFALFVIADLGRGQGILGRIFSLRVFGRLSEASLPLFALQMPAGLWFCVAMLHSRHGTSMQLVGSVIWTLGLSMFWAEWVYRPLIERFRSGHVTPPAEPLTGRTALQALGPS